MSRVMDITYFLTLQWSVQPFGAHFVVTYLVLMLGALLFSPEKQIWFSKNLVVNVKNMLVNERRTRSVMNLQKMT